MSKPMVAAVLYYPRTDSEGGTMTKPTIDHVFNLLDNWRHLPKYQLERRADIYFAMFLADVLKEHCGTSINPIIIPEFPLKKDNNQSDNPDYFALSADCKRAFLVELKTDMTSLKEGQASYLASAAKKDLHAILSGLKSIIINTSGDAEKKMQNRRKYFHLFEDLEALGLIQLPSGLKDLIIHNDNHRGLKSLVDKVNVACSALTPEIIYILPKEPDLDKQPYLTGIEIITFEKFANIAKDQGPVGNRFAESLMKWVDPV